MTLPIPVRLRVLGCSGSIAAGSRTTAFLLDDHTLIDAGTGVGDLPLDAMACIDDIVVSHSHLDHVLAIPLLADSVMKLRFANPGRGPIRVHGLPQTLVALRTHLFNGQLWPDFTSIPSPERPILALHPFEIGDTLSLGSGATARRVEVLPAAHTVPACGFAVDTPQGWWVYSGDTGPNPALWAALKGRRIAHLIIETAFGDDERWLADLSGHLSPSSLAAELAQLDGIVPVHITHPKPGEVAVVVAQVRAIDTAHRVEPLVKGMVFEL
ncbi:3',5'-cyclic-nucleotide phosphodiesterase [Methylibium sp.]|uniref:3',5'-cyclic-nucleotide phosphodiesterase n=1 Tax=Methylibium sp. TaxID=2067992 RepID=UPI00286BC3CD|nr:3',5'-cyclic-nucleotide phosphodiesterase [Methylibium sp.]